MNKVYAVVAASGHHFRLLLTPLTKRLRKFIATRLANLRICPESYAQDDQCAQKHLHWNYKVAN